MTKPTIQQALAVYYENAAGKADEIEHSARAVLNRLDTLYAMLRVFNDSSAEIRSADIADIIEPHLELIESRISVIVRNAEALAKQLPPPCPTPEQIAAARTVLEEENTPTKPRWKGKKRD